MDLKVPTVALPYLLLQRTQYLTFPRIPWCGRLFRAANRVMGRPADDYFGSPLFKPAVRLEGRLRRRAIATAYAADLRRDFATIAPHLPKPCAHVLDIGCGIAGIDVMLHRHLGDRLEALHLLDKSAVERRIFYGFDAAGAFYNSLAVARRLLVANGVPAPAIRTMEATADNVIALEGPLDLVISVISWGFHYPVETYLDRVHTLLRPGGRVILDVRKGQGGEAALARRFANTSLVADFGRWTRIAATRL